jgi:esterase/lipase
MFLISKGGQYMKNIFLALLYGLLGLFMGGLAVYILTMLTRPNLEPWHQVRLDAEFTANDSNRIADLEGYMHLEDELFGQLEEQIYDRSGDGAQKQFNRFHKGSWSDPSRFDFNWNRTFELKHEAPICGFLMLHGLSDSPYSMRSLSLTLHKNGASVIGLRLPGHGTAPVGLADMKWQDLVEATQLASRHIAKQIGPNRPLYIVGYSNGAALALEYSFSAMGQKDLRRPDGLILFSPAVAVSPMAALAKWNRRLSHLPGLEKLAWLSIEREYDPYKYNSFAVNAGEQIHKLLKHLTRQINRYDPNGKGVRDFPSVLAFQSVVDATIPPNALVENLMKRLAPNNHRLILFDINREANTAEMFAKDPHGQIENLFKMSLPFDLSLITNRHPSTRALIVRKKKAMTNSDFIEDLGFEWPKSIYSLSHVAIPFPPDDPLYGRGSKDEDMSFTLGSLEPRGERGLLQVSIEDLMRLRYNPFYPYIEKCILDLYFPDKTTKK